MGTLPFQRGDELSSQLNVRTARGQLCELTGGGPDRGNPPASGRKT